MLKTFLIGLGGLVGTIIRYWLTGLLARQYGETLPWGTIAVNLIGCFLAGVVFHVAEERMMLDPTARAVIFVGLFGGFTTFSAYGLQTFVLLRDGHFGLAVLNISAANLVGLLLVWAGYALGKAV
jgi:CrcB protein